MAFVKVAQRSELAAGQSRCVKIEGIPVGLFAVGDEVFAMENTCPHAGYPLNEGDLDGAVITCPAHGWDYDVRTGFPPDSDDGFPIPCFAVKIEDDAIWVDLEEKLNERPRSRWFPTDGST